MSDRPSIDLQDVSRAMKLSGRLFDACGGNGMTLDDVQAALDDRKRRAAVMAAFKGSLQLPARSRKSTTMESIVSSFVIPMPLIAHDQIEPAFRRDPGPERPDLELDPLNLGPGWAEKIMPSMVIDTPKGKFEVTPDWLREYSQYCPSDAGGFCTPIPTLYIPKIVIAGKSTDVDIKFMTDAWSWTHDGIQPGIQIRRFQCSNWMLGIDYCEIASLSLPGTQPYWRLNCWPSPAWTANLNWTDQQAAIADRKMMSNDAQHQLWFVNLASASGIAQPDGICSRVDTMVRGYPLHVELWGRGVGLHRDWHPRARDPNVRAAVSGVDWNFGT